MHLEYWAVVPSIKPGIPNCFKHVNGWYHDLASAQHYFDWAALNAAANKHGVKYFIRE